MIAVGIDDDAFILVKLYESAKAGRSRSACPILE